MRCRRYTARPVQQVIQLNRPIPIIVAIATIGTLLTSCGESRAIQCNRLIEVANRAVDEVQAVTQAAGPEDTEAHLQVAEIVDRAAGDLEGITLSDDQLRRYQQQFIAMYTNTSKATRELMNAVDNQGGIAMIEQAQAAERAYQDLQEATSREEPLVNDINAYCNAGNFDTEQS